MQNQTKILAYLTDRFESRPQSASAVPLLNGTEYVNLCTHPEVIERLWWGLSATLPENCCDIMYGTPVLRHPRSGLIFAIGLGTYYALGISSRMLKEVQFEENDFVRVGYVNYKDKKTIDLREIFGPGWIFGNFREAELEWCRAAYEEAGGPDLDSDTGDTSAI
jgi:hypothetical protein